MNKAKILIIDHQPESRASLERLLSDGRRQVVAVPDGQSALRQIARADFDLIISDLAIGNHDGDGSVNGLRLIAEISRKAHAPVVISTDATGQNIHKAFRAGAANYLLKPWDRNELEKIIEKALAYQSRLMSDAAPTPGTREIIEIELPSDVNYLDGVLTYLVERTARYGIISPSSSNTFVALDEALSNAIKHGNQNDPAKKVHIRVELSADEARFTIRDEGQGFNPLAIPDPLDPANLFKNSGRGVLLIQHIMDEVKYNERGNEVTMIKRPEKK
ncbi:MAG: ATP-binding protein [Blastocatellia bacterium]